MMTANKKIIITLYIVVCLFGCFLIVYSTSSGLSGGSDTVGYYEVARNIAAGRGIVVIRPSGLVVPLYLRPPMYPITMSIPRLVGIDMLNFNRYLNIGLFSVFLLVLGWSAYVNDQDLWYPISFAILIISSPTFLRVFSGAMSEPLFFTLGLLSVAFLIQYLHSKNRRHLGFSAGLAGLSTLARFNGAVFILVGIFMIMWFSKWKKEFEWRDLFLFTCISFLPVLIWLIGLFTVGYTPGIYQTESINIWKTLTKYRVSLVEHIWEWFPGLSIFGNQDYRGKLFIIILVMICLFLLVGIRIKKAKAVPRQIFTKLCTYQIVIWSFLFVMFIIFHAFSYVFIKHPKPALNDRLFSPIQLSFWGLILSVLFYFPDKNPKICFRWIFIGIFIVSTVAFNIPKTVSTLSELQMNKSGVTSGRWRSSDVMRELSKMPESIPLISNDTSAINFYTERAAYEITELVEGVPQDVYQPFGENADREEEIVFREQGAALVLFTHGIYYQFWPIYQRDTRSRLDSLTSGLYVYYKGQDGAIYFYDSPGVELTQ